MTDRIARMKAALKTDKYTICAEKARYFIEAWERHEGLPAILKNAYHRTRISRLAAEKERKKCRIWN